MRRSALALVCLLGASLPYGCGEEEPPLRYTYPPTSGTCGNGVKDIDEVCDGTELGGISCQSLGIGSGVLACAANCAGFDTSACGGTCTPECGARECGPDPVCGVSCGICAGGATCSGGVCDTTDPSGPVFLSFSTNITTMDRYDQLVFSAVLTDPDGVDDLIGGTLADPVSGGTYGAFTTAASEGSYTLTLSWSEIQTVRAIYTPEGGAARAFRAEFFDTAGHRTRQELSVTLVCADAPAFAVCNGSCADLDTSDQHCGACDRPVSDGYCLFGQMACWDGQEACGDGCIDVLNHFGNCGACGHSCSDEATSYDGRALDCYDGQCLVVVPSTTLDACATVCAAIGKACTWGGLYECYGDPYDDGYGCFHYEGDASCTESFEPPSCETAPAATLSWDCTNSSFASAECVCH